MFRSLLILSANSGNWFTDLIRDLFFTIDKIIYDGISKVYDLFETLSRVSIMSHGQIANFGERISELLAIFMVFKVTISLITYVVNPDGFNDKSKGIGPLTRNVVLVLALLILTPYFFTYAYKFQTMVLADNIIPKLIFGDESSNNISSGGETMSFMAMNAFFYPDSSVVSGCVDLTTTVANKVTINGNCSGYPTTNKDNRFPEAGETKKSEKPTYNNLKEVVEAVHADGDDTFKAADVGNYVTGFEHKNPKLVFRQRLITAKTPGGTYIFDYSYFLSTAVGVVILLLLVSFCMDIGVRSIKLAFLQMVAPIPIISYIDPNSGKDGMFKKWYKECFGTYLSLFIRLFVIYFVIYIVGLIGDADLHDMTNGTEVTGFWLKLFILIGALIFAKQFPKLLESLGLKMDGGFTLNPFRKIEKEALGGSIMKKPADFAGKAAKFAVGGGLIVGGSLLGKKTIGAIDSARNGGDLKTGWNNTHGKLYNSFYKKLDEWAPDSAETRKNRLKGRKNQELRKRREDIGRPMATEINQELDNLAYANGYRNASEWKSDDYPAYAREKYRLEAQRFRNAEYRQSYVNLQERKIQANLKQQEATDMDQKYQSILNGQTIRYNNVDYTLANAEDFKKIRDGASASAASAQSKVKAAETKHEDVKLKYTNDANTELAYDEYGKTYNWVDGEQGVRQGYFDV